MLDNKHSYDVSIIIVNYNTSKLINDCIESIIKLTNGVTYEIIVVDNNTEDLSEVIKEASNPIVRLIQLPENVGFGRANNEGFKMSQGRNLFCLNPDTLLLNNAVKILSDYLDTHPKCGACGGNLYDSFGKPIHSFRRTFPGILDSLIIFSNYNLAKIIYGKSHEFNHSGKELNVAYITGADLMIPRYVIDKVGMYDTKFFMYFEETDLCYRISKSGYKICAVPFAKIIHLVSVSHKSFNTDTNNDIINPNIGKIVGSSRQYYFIKNLTKFESYLSNIILLSNYFLRWIISFPLKNKILRKVNYFQLKIISKHIFVKNV